MSGVAPSGYLVDVNTICKRLKRLKYIVQRNQMSEAKTLLPDIQNDLDDLNDLLQAATLNVDLNASPTLSLTENP